MNEFVFQSLIVYSGGIDYSRVQINSHECADFLAEGLRNLCNGIQSARIHSESRISPAFIAMPILNNIYVIVMLQFQNLGIPKNICQLVTGQDKSLRNVF